jgi:LPXTG-motif cell wall-anchored protein
LFTNAMTKDFGHAGVQTFTTARSGTKLFVRWSSDHNVMTSATAKTDLCSTPPPTPCTTVSAVTSHGAITGATQGGTAMVTFTLSEACVGKELSLVSYTASSATFSRETASEQVVFRSQTGTFAGGTHTFSVLVPSCFFQVDFVLGAVIAHLGPASSNNFYSDQGRLIEGVNGGTKSCVESTTVTPPTTTTTPPATTPAPEVERAERPATSVASPSPAQAVAGVQTPPSVIGAVMPIVSAPVVSQVAPSTVQGVQKAPVAGVQNLPSTSTDSAPTFPLAAVGLALMIFGGVLLRRRYSED